VAKADRSRRDQPERRTRKRARRRDDRKKFAIKVHYAIAVTWANLTIYAVSASDGCVPDAFIGW